MKVHGPQSDRKTARLNTSFVPSSITKTLEIASPKYSHESELIKLRSENKLAKDELSRTLAELKYYQANYPSKYPAGNGPTGDDVPIWVFREDVMLPLFEAYDNRILDLEHTLEIKMADLARIHDQVSDLILENEQLRAMTLDRNKNSSSAKHEGVDMRSSFHSEMVNELNERVDLLMNENSLLVEQKLVLTSELEKHHEELFARLSDIDKLIAECGEKDTTIERLNSQIEQIKSERESAASHAFKYSEALSSADLQNERLHEKVLVLERRIKELEGNLSQQKIAMDSSTKDLEEQSIQLLKKMRFVDERNQELQNLLSQKTVELDETLDAMRKLKREYQSTRSDAESMLQVMSGLERQLSDYTNKEVEMERITRECKTKMEEACIQRDQILLKEEYYSNEIQRLQMDKLESSKKFESDLEMKVIEIQRKAQGQIDKIEQEMRKMVEIIAQQRNEVDSCQRERNVLKDQLEGISDRHNEHFRQLELALESLKDRLKASEVQREFEVKRKVEAQDKNVELRSLVNNLQKQVEQFHHKNELSEKTILVENDRSKTTIDNLQNLLQQKEKEMIECQRNYDNLSHEFDSFRVAMEKKVHEEVASYRLRLTELEKYVAESEENDSPARQNQLLNQIKDSYCLTSINLDMKLKEEAENIRVLKKQNSDYSAKIMEYQLHQNDLLGIIEEAKLTIASLQVENRKLSAWNEMHVDNMGSLNDFEDDFVMEEDSGPYAEEF